MNFGFRVDADEFELKGELCSGTIWPRSDGTLRLGKNHRRAAQALPHTSLTLGVVVLDPLCATILSIFDVLISLILRHLVLFFCLNIFEKYLRLASVRYLSRRFPFFYFYDSLRGFIGPFASLLNFIIRFSLPRVSGTSVEN